MSRLRVIGGALRGRKLEAPRTDATRPTLDRVRESIFNLLGPLPPGLRVLDLFAGSGALGIEALSRGAESVVFVERAREPLRTLRANVAALDLAGRARISTLDAGTSAAWGDGPFDLAFADPPWPDAYEDAVLAAAAAGLAPGGRLVLEHPRERTPPLAPEPLELRKERSYGATGVAVYGRSEAD